MEETKIVFECYKCRCQLHQPIARSLSAQDIMDKLHEISELDCPECGEEGHLNWKLYRVVY